MFKTINPKKNLIINIVVIIVLTLFVTFLIFFLYKNTSMFDKFSKYSNNDKTSPEITKVTLKSDNTYNENYAEEGIESYKDTNGNEGDSYILIPSKSTLTIVKKGTIIKDIK